MEKVVARRSSPEIDVAIAAVKVCIVEVRGEEPFKQLCQRHTDDPFVYPR